MALVACLAASPAQAQPIHDFDIAPGPLHRALVEFAIQAGISLALPDESLAGASTTGLAGAYRIEDGLGQLLAGSNWIAEATGDAAWRVFARPSPPPPPVERALAPLAPSRPETITVIARSPMALRQLSRSVSRIDGIRLEEPGIQSLSQLAGDLGGVLFTNTGDGRNKIATRGVSDGATSGRAQATTGIYLDDVRLTYAAPDPDLQLVDIGSVEILRGPQGALYGAGAIGGILRISPRPVNTERAETSLLVGGELTEGGEAGHNLEWVGNLPLAGGRAGVRAVLYDRVDGGWIDHRDLGLEAANRATRQGGRLTGLVHLPGGFDLGGGLVFQTIDVRDSQYLLEADGGPERRPGLLEPHDNDFLSAHIRLDGETGWGDITSTTALVQHELGSRYDATGLFTRLPIVSSATRPLDQYDRLNMVMHETRLTAPAGAAHSWFIGLFVADGDFDSEIALRDGTAGNWNTTPYAEHRRDGIDEAALFGAMTWNIRPGVRLETGARAFSYGVQTHSITEIAGAADPVVFDGTLRRNGIAPDIRLSWQATRQLRLSLSAAEGYRSPGFNTGGIDPGLFDAPGQPDRRYRGDELWAYELGLNYRHPSGRFDASLIAFANDWRDIQTDDLLAGDLVQTGNAGDSRAWGLEGDVRWQASGALELHGHFIVSEPEITRVDAGFEGLTDSGLPGVSEYAASASARYVRATTILGHALDLTAEGTALYQGPATLGFGLGAPVGEYADLSMRLSLSDGRTDIGVYAENILGSDGGTFSNGNPYQISRRTMVTPVRPRTIGISVRQRF